MNAMQCYTVALHETEIPFLTVQHLEINPSSVDPKRHPPISLDPMIRQSTKALGSPAKHNIAALGTRPSRITLGTSPILDSQPEEPQNQA